MGSICKGNVIGLSIRKNAKSVGVSVKTSFYMRHKLLDCIRTFMGIGNVDGVIEMDETFNKEIIRTKNMLIHSTIPFVDTKIKNYKERIATIV